jgi:hypothetical protein
MAAMAWAVEHELHGTLDAPVDAYRAYLAREAKDPVQKPAQKPGDPAIFYTLESIAPDNWIPLVPVQTKLGQLVFRRGVIERLSGGSFVGNAAHASILEPGVPLLFDRSHHHAGRNSGKCLVPAFARNRRNDIPLEGASFRARRRAWMVGTALRFSAAP